MLIDVFIFLFTQTLDQVSPRASEAICTVAQNNMDRNRYDIYLPRMLHTHRL